MLKTLLCLAALIACAMSAAILFNEVGPQRTPHIIGWETTKQYGGAVHQTASSFPWAGQQAKEYLMGVLAQPGYHHGIESAIPVWSPGYQHGVLLHQAGMAVQQPLGIQGDEWQGLGHGVADQAAHLFVDENGVLHHGIGIHQHVGVGGWNQLLAGQEGLQSILWQEQHQPSQLVYPHYQGQQYITSEGLLNIHPQQISAIPVIGGISQLNNDVDDSILLQKLYPTQHVSGGLLGHQIGQGLEDATPLIAVGPYGHGVGVMQQTQVWPFQVPSGVHQWHWTAENHHY